MKDYQEALRNDILKGCLITQEKYDEVSGNNGIENVWTL